MLNESNLHNYQRHSVEFMVDNTHAACLLEMGLGKTPTTLTVINQLIHRDLEIDKVLIVAPKRVVETVWDTEARKWEHLKHLTFSKVTGDVNARKKALAAKADIYLIGRDSIAWLCGLYGGSMLPFDMLVIDESSSFKAPDSQRFKALKMVQPSFKRVVLLTGTPSPNGLIDLWAQIWLLDRGERLGRTISFYRDNFFKRKFSGFGYEPQQDTQERIQNKIKDIVISMKAEDYIELPDRIDTFIDVILSPKDMKAYKDFERDKVLEMYSNDTEITAMNAAALYGKLLQFAGGAIYDEERNVHVIHDAKIEATEEFIESANGRPVFILYRFKHEYDRLMSALKKFKPRKIENSQDLKAWNSGKIEIGLGHPASMGHGLNMQEGDTCLLWYSLPDSLELYQQANARLHRQGRKFPVTIGLLIAKGTGDETVLRSLGDKDQVQDALMESVKALVKKYI